MSYNQGLEKKSEDRTTSDNPMKVVSSSLPREFNWYYISYLVVVRQLFPRRENLKVELHHESIQQSPKAACAAGVTLGDWLGNILDNEPSVVLFDVIHLHHAIYNIPVGPW